MPPLFSAFAVVASSYVSESGAGNHSMSLFNSPAYPSQLEPQVHPPIPFVWGTSSAAWQYEGAVTEDGRGSCIWADFCSNGRCFRHEMAGVAVGQYDLRRWMQASKCTRRVKCMIFIAPAWQCKIAKLRPSSPSQTHLRGMHNIF